jgi:cobalt/nickel transport system ATP-binding protein
MLIDVDRVTLKRDAAREILSDCSFTLAERERVGLQGPNGCGKSSFLWMLMGLLLPEKGRIEILGKRREREKDFREIRGPVGLVFQDSDDQLFCSTVLEDIAFGPLNFGKSKQQARGIAAEVLSRIGLEGYENRLTHHLSGGEKRLVALATVLAMQPAIYLFDEPLAGLDEAACERVVRLLESLPEAMIIASHDHAFLDRIATRKVRLSDGKFAPA